MAEVVLILISERPGADSTKTGSDLGQDISGLEAREEGLLTFSPEDFPSDDLMMLLLRMRGRSTFRSVFVPSSRLRDTNTMCHEADLK